MAISDGLLFYWKLDAIVDGKVLDSSGNDLPGTIMENIQLVSDDRFGTCLSFSDWILDDIRPANADEWTQEHSTSTFWVKYNNAGQMDTPIPDAINDGAWHHLAIVAQNRRDFILYKDGQLVTSQSLLDQTMNLIAGVYGVIQMAHFRFYDRLLSAQEIGEIIQTEQASIFRESFPLDLDLYDEDDMSVIYISDDPASQRLQLVVTNRSGQRIDLEAAAGVSVGPDDHHLELRFRPGTLFNPSGITLAENEWTLAHQTNSDQTDSLYFLRPSGQALPANQTITLTLQGLSADRDQGARGSRVELRYGNSKKLTYPNQTLSIRGYRTQQIQVLSQQGQKNLPLHVGIVGSNRVLNDGSSANSLNVRLTNLQLNETLRFNATSKFILSFDAGDTSQEWALGTTSEVQGVTISSDQGAIQEDGLTWILTGLSDLAARGAISLTLDNIVTGHPDGLTNLYVSYENIPGYWDGHFVCPIEKAPLVFVA